MKKTFVCIFAHPDDEAFGPGGTVATLAQDHDVYVLCATRGEAGEGGGRQLGKIRSGELRQSAKILGVTGVDFLGFKDGELSNSLYHALAAKIESKLLKYKPSEIMTYEPRGVSGHIDHIAVSMATSYVFYRLKFVKKLWYYCLPEKMVSKEQDYFVYMPPGYKAGEIDKTVDVSPVWEKRLAAVRAHQSQKKDMDFMLEYLEKHDKKEHFFTLSK